MEVDAIDLTDEMLGLPVLSLTDACRSALWADVLIWRRALSEPFDILRTGLASGPII